MYILTNKRGVNRKIRSENNGRILGKEKLIAALELDVWENKPLDPGYNNYCNKENEQPFKIVSALKLFKIIFVNLDFECFDISENLLANGILRIIR